MTQPITDSQFYIWRTLFAVAHADNVVTDEEVKFMAHVMDEVDFSDEQSELLKDDLHNAKNAEEMFMHITNQKDREQFFDLARDLVWVDGDFDQQEQNVMVRLHKMHIKNVNVDTLIGNVELELEEDQTEQKQETSPKTKKGGFFDVISMFKNRFSNDA